MSERLGNFGYAFANVNANPEINRDKKEVSFTILVDPGKRVYVRRINIGGNTRTRDEVVRREFRQFEGSWYDGEKIKRSRDRVDRLGYFKEVTIETPEVPGTPDQVDVNMTVEERPTGNIMVGAGYSSSEKLTLSGNIQQANAFGSGNTLGVEINTSKINKTYAFSQTNPYFTDEGVSRSLEVSMRTMHPALVNSGDFRTRTTGASVRFGVPFSEEDTVFFGIGAERAKVQTYPDSPSLYKEHVTKFGDGVSATTMTYPLSVAWQRDSRDSALTPSIGHYQRAFLEFSPAGDSLYYRGIYQYQYFKPLFGVATLALNGELDYGEGLRGKPYPVFKNFYAGGIGSVRGYESSSLGPKYESNSLDPKSTTTSDTLGGSKRLIGNVELLFPFPGQGKDKSLRWFAFYDIGNVFAEDERIRFGDLRTSAGMGISWISPVGPLKLSYGIPLNAKTGDEKERIQFQMGTGF